MRALGASLFRRRRVLLAALVLAGLAWLGHGMWRMARVSLRADPRYVITAKSIEIPPLPEWIRSDIKAQALAEAGLYGELSVLDPPEQVNQRIVDALQFHPWVKDVRRIELSPPNRMRIDLTYRRPVAAVELAEEGASHLLPVDEEAVRLPQADLTETELRYLPRIAGAQPKPRVGEAWVDERVRGALALIGRLGEDWSRLLLEDVIPSQREIRGPKQFFRYELVTRGGTKIVWGAAPYVAAPGEASFNEKLARLKHFVTENGPLDTARNTPQLIDLRYGLRTEEREAKKPEEPSGPRTARNEEESDASGGALKYNSPARR